MTPSFAALAASLFLGASPVAIETTPAPERPAPPQVAPPASDSRPLAAGCAG